MPLKILQSYFPVGKYLKKLHNPLLHLLLHNLKFVDNRNISYFPLKKKKKKEIMLVNFEDVSY